jgi:hypothetical protein
MTTERLTIQTEQTVSDCCNAEWIIGHSDAGKDMTTNFHICKKCGKPCGVVEA